MIKINLARRKTANLVSAGNDSGDSRISSMKSLFSRSSGSGSGEALKDWPIRSILIALAGIYGTQFYFEAEKTSEIARVESTIEKLRASQRELQSKLSGAAGFEEVKRNFGRILNILHLAGDSEPIRDHGAPLPLIKHPRNELIPAKHHGRSQHHVAEESGNPASLWLLRWIEDMDKLLKRVRLTIQLS